MIWRYRRGISVSGSLSPCTLKLGVALKDGSSSERSLQHAGPEGRQRAAVEDRAIDSSGRRSRSFVSTLPASRSTNEIGECLSVPETSGAPRNASRRRFPSTTPAAPGRTSAATLPPRSPRRIVEVSVVAFISVERAVVFAERWSPHRRRYHARGDALIGIERTFISTCVN